MQLVVNVLFNLNFLSIGCIKKLNKCANSHAYYPIDILRIALGIFLALKGIYFFKNSSYLESLLVELNFDNF